MNRALCKICTFIFGFISLTACFGSAHFNFAAPEMLKSSAGAKLQSRRTGPLSDFAPSFDFDAFFLNDGGNSRSGEPVVYTLDYNGGFISGSCGTLLHTGNNTTSRCAFVTFLVAPHITATGAVFSDLRSLPITIGGSFFQTSSTYYVMDYYGSGTYSCSYLNGYIYLDARWLTESNGRVSFYLVHPTPSPLSEVFYDSGVTIHEAVMKTYHSGDSNPASVCYGADTSHQVMKIFVPSGYYDEPLPIVMNIYGSAFQQQTYGIDKYAYLQNHLLSNLFIQVRIDLRLTIDSCDSSHFGNNGVNIDGMLSDIHTAIGFLYALATGQPQNGPNAQDYPICTERMCLWGHSSGGNIALDYVLGSYVPAIPVTMIVTEGAPMDLSTIHSHPGCAVNRPNSSDLALFAQVVEGQSSDYLWTISPSLLLNVTTKNMDELPFFVVANFTNDNTVCINMAQTFVDLLTAKELNDSSPSRHASLFFSSSSIDPHKSYDEISFNLYYLPRLMAFKSGDYDI